MHEADLLEKLMAKFDVGRVVITPAATAALASVGQSLDDVLARHQAGDWGDVSPREREVNDRGLIESFNLQSAYQMDHAARLVVVTNRERTMTLVHLDRVAVVPNE